MCKSRFGGYLLAAGLLLLNPALCASTAGAVEVEKDAVLGDSFKGNQKVLDAAAAIIEAYGYRCDSISSALRWVMNRGFTVTCNHYAYTYELQDRGGTWVAKFKD